MTTDEIRELIQLVHETGITELEVQRGENRVRIRSGVNATAQDILLAAGQGGSAVHTYGAPATASPATPGSGLPKEDDDVILVKSPIVGTYYDSPSPTAAPFVKPGDMVEPKHVLCIIESMKLMNEIEAEVAGTVLAKLVENGRPVEYGEALFRIRPR
ncbi:MAG: acetyl-CoA carboxylase biotin carboxyl carrier protein [Bryobacteraceae bacterium]